MKFSTWFKDRSIRQKLILITFLAGGVAMLFTIVISTIMQWFMLREELIKNISAQASIIAQNSESALVSNDRKNAEKTLNGLANIDNIVFAGILDKTGKTFALYIQPGLAMPPHQHPIEEVEGDMHTATYIEVVVPIVFKQEQIGSIHVRSNLSPVYESLKWNIAITVVAFVGAFLGAVLMLLRLLPSIINPMESLVGLMKRVSHNNNFSLRAKPHGKDEMGTLANWFNTMLEQIQIRDNALAQHRQDLEAEIAQRTADLLVSNTHLGKELAEREAAEQELKDNNEQLSVLLDSLPIAAYRCLAEGDFAVTYMSNTVFSFTGYESENFIKNTDLWFAHIHPEDEEIVEDAIIILFEKGTHTCEYRWLSADGTYIWIQDSMKLIVSEDATAPYMVGMWQNITERKVMEENIRKQQEFTNLIIETIPMRIFWKDKDLCYLGCNTLFAKDAGFMSPEELKGKNDFDMVWKDHAEYYRADDQWVIDSNTAKLSYDEPQITPEGGQIWLRTSKVPLQNDTNNTIGVLGVYEAITAYKEMELKLRESEQRFRNIAELTTDWVWQVDENGNYVYAGDKIHALLGYDPEELYGKSPFIFMPPEEAARVEKIFKNIVAEQKPFSFLENITLHKDGHSVFLETSGIPLISDEGIFHGYFGTEHDISARKRIEEEMNLLATTDSLTGLVNRREFRKQLEKEIERANRYGTPLSLVMYDIDYFKRVNDTFGHDVGDYVLQALTTVVKTNIRAVDVVARWGGEEFMILMPQSDSKAAASVTEKLRKEIVNYYFEHVGNLTVSFGITAFTLHDNLDVFLKRVDDALYRAKENGRNRVEIMLDRG